MGKRSNRLLETLEETKAENADFLIRTRSADTIMARELSHKMPNTYMTAFVPFVQKSLDAKGGSIHGLRGNDINESAGIATLTAKGGERETVPVLPHVLEILTRYRTRPIALLFPDSNGNRYQDVPDSFGRAVDFLGLNNSGEFAMNEKGEQIPIKISDARHRVIFHTLRHTFASRLAQSGQVGIYELMKLMRHKRIETTLRYAHLIPSEQRKKLDTLVALMPK